MKSVDVSSNACLSDRERCNHTTKNLFVPVGNSEQFVSTTVNNLNDEVSACENESICAGKKPNSGKLEIPLQSYMI